jgi:ddrB-like ParB superfamily domain/P-loop containing NTP hydrolase pore-1
MADPAVATPEAPPAPKTFKIPVEGAAPDTHTHGGKQFKIPVSGAKTFELTFDPTKKTPPTQPDAPKEQNYIRAYEPSWWERTKNVFGKGGAGGGLSDAAFVMKHGSGDMTAAFGQFMQHPLAGFEELFPANPKSAIGRVAKGAASAASGMTSPTQAALMVAPMLGSAMKLEALPQAFHAIGMAMLPTVGVGTVQSAKRIYDAHQSGDKAAEQEAYGDLGFNLLMVAGPHAASKFAEGNGTAKLNEKSTDLYQQKFISLDDHQKAHVLYAAIEDADPKFKKRVDQEVAKIQKTTGRSALATAQPIVRDEQQKAAERVEISKKLISQMAERQARDEAYKHQQAQREHEARQTLETQETARRTAQEEIDAKRRADEIKPQEEERGFPVTEGRTAENLPVTGLRKTTEREPGQRYDPEPAEGGISATDRRAAASEPLPERTPQLVAADARVQELSEQQMGQSFSSLPVYRQKVAAEWIEKNHPEAWEAFKQTPAYEQHAIDVKHADLADSMLKRYLDRNETGDREPLAPGADLAGGTARLILGRANVDAILKADPATSKDLNEHTEKLFGSSFDVLDETRRIPALAEYLRSKPGKVQAFLSVDLKARMESGQNVDLANMSAEQMARQRVELKMSARDSIRRAMDTDVAQHLITEERTTHQKELTDALYASLTGKTPALEEVYRVSKGLTEQASRMGFGQVATLEDLFKIESDALSLPARTRTPAVNEFLTRMRQVRAAAEEHVLRELAETTASQFRADAEGATEPAAKQVVQLSSQVSDLQQAADDFRAQGKEQQADAAQRAADYSARKADAIVAGAESIHTPAPINPPKFVGKVVPGRAVRAVSEGGVDLPAHFALIEAADARTSHMPFTYEPREGYNQNGQPRNYKTSRNAQARVETVAAGPDPDKLLSNGVEATVGPPILDQKLDVISGNRRALGLLTALRTNPEGYSKYLAAMRVRAAEFGIEPTEVLKFTNPLLVKILDNPIESEIEWTRLGTEFNRGPEGGMNEEEQGEAMKRLLTPEFTDRLTTIIESLPTADKDGRATTAREAMRARGADIAQLLQDAGIITKNKLEEYLTDDGELKEKAKDLFENMLTSLTVTDSDVLNKAPAEVKDKLGRAGLFFSKMQSAGENWNVASYNTDAVRLFTRAKDAQARLNALQGKKEAEVKGATGGESLMERYLHPERFHDPAGANVELSFDNQPLVPPQHPVIEALAMALEESPRNYASMLAKYANRAVGQQGSMFGAEHPADAFTNEIASNYGLKVIPEEWGTVGPMPEVVKAAIENSRGPLPVEPSVHAETAIADVQPNAESVTDVMAQGPKTVQDLRKALETHPNVKPEEAAALTDLFEEILPRAMGESLSNLLGNRRLNVELGGKEGGNRAYLYIEDGKAIIRLMDSADTSSFLHEMAHYVRNYLNPEDQATANGFVGAKPGEAWTDPQEEKFAQAFERYHYDGGIRRGKLEKVFSTISKAMQSIYNAVTGKKLAKGTPELNAMFDKWYDWTRAERKPITARLDVDALEQAAKDDVQIPDTARMIERGGRPVSDKAQNFVFLDKDAARDFIKNKKNGVRGYEMHQVRGELATYVKADAKKGKKLYQPSLSETLELARRARDLEAQLKRENDPRRQALLRGQLNGIEDKLKGATGVIGGGNERETKDTSAIQLVHGISELPGNEPTTPAQAVTAQGVFGDPTGIALGNGGERGKSGRASDGPAGIREEEPTRGLPEQRGAADGEHGAGDGERTPIAKPAKSPLHDVKAAKLKEPEKDRGTPVVDPGKWRDHVEALGLPTGTPPPTVRMDPTLREMAIYPGQSEAIEGALSALQQHDATVLAAGLGTGKTFLNSAIASHLMGEGGDKVGIIITRSQNLVHEADGYIEWGHKIGLTVEPLPTDMSKVQTGGVYAGTYAQIRGNRDTFAIPWDFAIFDESAEARNWTESDQGRAVVMLGHAAKKVVYASATPYSTVMEMGYMHKLGLWPKGGFGEWASQFGLKEIAPNTYSGGTSAKRLTKLRQQLIERGQWQTLYKDMDGVEGHVALIPQTDEVKAGIRSIRSAFAKAAKGFQQAGMSRYLTPTLGHEAIYLKRYIAGTKLKGAIDLAQRLVKNGWAPILFTEYRSPAEDGMAFFHNLPGELGQEINKMLPPLPDVVGQMREAFGNKIGIFAGEANTLRAEELEGFQSGDKDAIYMTYGAGAVGANAQDKVGDRPRAAIFVDLPWGGMMFEQGTGRPWRYGSKSNVSMFFLTSDALPEMKLLATKILPRMRSLKAAVYGEKIESNLAKNLRGAVGLPEEMLEYEQGEEVKPQGAEWEQAGEGAKYTHLADLELPDAKKAKNKGMKYKGQGRKLYQGPKDDPFEKAASAAWDEIMGKTRSMPAPEARAITANEAIVKPEAVEAGRRAMGTGEPVKNAVERKVKDSAIDAMLSDQALLAFHGSKKNARNIARFVQDTGWMLATSGDRVVEKSFKRAGLEKEGVEMKRRMIDFDLRKGLYQGRMQAVIRNIVHGNNLKPKDIELMSKVVEGQTTTDDARVNKAAGEFRTFTGDVRQALADAGSVVVIYQDGFRKEVPYSAIDNDPRYWPRMYDWNKPFLIKDKVTGKRESTTLAEIMNMPTSDVRRERFIDQFAEERGISKLQAQAFFEKNTRGIRLAGNVERAREWEIPMYGRDRQAIERYIDQVATTMAATEVHGQFRQKTDPIISKLPQHESSLVNRIVTSDLDPAHLPEFDRAALSLASSLVVTGKMFYSPIKVLTHLWKASLATNTRSVVGGLLRGVTHPTELFERARDCNALLDYSKSAWLREYGIKRGNIGAKFLDFSGFTFEVQASRILATGMGRLWLEKYAYPALVKDPQNASLRRKLTDLYGMDDTQIDRMAKEGYSADDVRRAELATANWVTGSNRPSEMPPMFRATKDADPAEHKIHTLFRMTQMLHGFMFKTANLVNRTVFDELYKSNWKSIEPYHLITRFAFNAGLAGFALEQLLHLRHTMTNSAEGEIEKRRHEWLEQHPASAEALYWSMANISMAIGIQPLADLFDKLGTRDPKDRQKLDTEKRFTKGVMGMPLGIPGQDVEAISTAFEDYTDSFADTGKHKQLPEERRANILKRLLNEEVVGSSLIPGAKPDKVAPVHHGRQRKTASRF